MTAPKKRSYAQHERQHDEFRDGGRYHAMNPCELCGKGVGATYYTSKWQDEIGKGLILDKACCTKVDAMTEEQARAAFHMAPKPKASTKPAIPPPPQPTPAMNAIKAKIEAIRKQLDADPMGGDTYRLKMDLMNLRTEHAKLWKAQTAGVDAKIVRVWQKWARGMG